MAFRTPKYRLHKGSSQALVQINGERIYLGKYGTGASKEKYRRLVAEFLAGGQKPKADSQSSHRFCPHRQGQRIDPGLLAPRQTAVRQERPAHQRDPQLPYRIAAPSDSSMVTSR